MRQADINKIRDRAVKSSAKYPCEEILIEKGEPIKRRGAQVYAHCYHCGESYRGSKKGIPDHFSINTTKNMYHCFGCAEGGGPAKLYSSLNNIPYIDSALTLALRLGDITEEEFKSASSSEDAIKKFNKGSKAIKKFEEQKACDVEVKAPPKITNLVYSYMLKLPVFKLTKEFYDYLINERNLDDETIRKIGFFTYSDEFNVDDLVGKIQSKHPWFTYNHLYGVPGFFFEMKSKASGVWRFKKPMPNCIGIPLRNADGLITALQMRNMQKNAKTKYYYVSSINESTKNSNYGYGSSPGSPVAVCYPETLESTAFYVGEGMFKMMELAKEGRIGFSVQGVNSIYYVADEIRATMAGEKIKNLPSTLPKGKKEIKLIIVFDADMYEKIQVLQAGLKASLHLAKEFPGKDIRFLLWRGEYGKGFDDMKFNLQAKGLRYTKFTKAVKKDDFLAIVKDAISKADAEYTAKHGDTNDVSIRTKPEYSVILKQKLYEERIKPMLPSI